MRRPIALLAGVLAAACGAPAPAVPPDAGTCEFSETQPAIDKVDFLLVVDDSPSMVEEQAALAAQLPQLITKLTSGDRDGDGAADVPPVTDLHAGVVTVDMGVGGIPNVPTCMTDADFGDDGVLRNAPGVAVAGCTATYPRFLSFRRDTTSPLPFAQDLACLARAGARGCGFEQPLDAALKALLPSTSPIRFYAGTHAHGDDPSTNGGFLRDDSVVVVLVVTDEDDCSTDQTDVWNPASTTHTGELNLRCVEYFDELYPIERFVDGLKSLRPASPNLVVFATLAGVPEDLVTLTAPRSPVDYARLFADPRMQNTVPLPGGVPMLQPACTAPGGRSATPGIRMARVAEGFGRQGVVQSICASDYGPALDAIVARVDALITNGVCFPYALARDATSGLVACDVIATIPAGACTDVPGADATPLRVAADGRLQCRTRQVAIDAATRATGLPPAEPATGGWYYDDYTSGSHCDQQIVFFPDWALPPDVTVSLECVPRPGARCGS